MIKEERVPSRTKRQRMSNSLRKHIRREKARIRREVLDPKEQKEQILKLREKLNKPADAKEVKPPVEAPAVKENDDKGDI